MLGLTIIVAGAEAARFHSALEVAAAHAALGIRTRLFLQSEAVPLLQTPLPDRFNMLEEVIALGASVTVCQSGLALAGMSAAQLPGGVDTGGLVELLATRGEDQLVIV